jgi:hypothetical protein
MCNKYVNSSATEENTMSEEKLAMVILSVDMKKYRIRIHKATLHKLGDPPYIQLLINPSSSIVALKAVDNASSKDQTHRVSKKALESSNSIEIYSKYFIDKLNELVPDLSDGNCYHMTGSIVPSERMAVFSFKTLQSFQEGESVCQ